ncbi:MAG: type II secretion system protein GspG [Phycisphaerales bacterium]
MNVKHTLRTVAPRGFTLLEMMLVLLIIGLLMTVAVMNLTGQSTTARIGTTKAKLSQYKTAINTYFISNGSYPVSLQAMVPNPLESVSKDAWKRDFVYSPNSNDPTKPYLLYSQGPKENDPSDDISVWNIDE